MILLRIARAVLRRAMWGVGWLLPIDSKKIVVMSFFGHGYGDSPKYIVEELLRRNTGHRVVWLVNKMEADTIPEGVHAVAYNSIAAVFHATTAKVWIDNCRRIFKYKKNKQFYIQTWHGFALKRIEKDVVDHLDEGYVKQAKKDAKATDLIVSDSEFMSGIYRKSFWYDGEIKQWGAPRCDILLNKEGSEDVRDKVYRFFDLDKTNKVLLYAPTFRANHSLEPYSIDYQRVKEACERAFGGQFKIFVRLHPGIAEKSKNLNIYNDYVLDASGYVDMQELLLAADIVISDYSSLIFDYALTEKPCFLFATDIKEYQQDRNFYFDLKTLPFPIGETNNALIDNIEHFNYGDYLVSLNAFFEKTGMVRTGRASKNCVDKIEEVCRR